MAMPKGQKANIGPENGHPQHTHTHTHTPLQVCIKKGAAMRGRGAVCNCVSQQDCRDIYINMTSCHTITHFLSLSLLIIIIIIVFVGCVYFYLFLFFFVGVGVLFYFLARAGLHCSWPGSPNNMIMIIGPCFWPKD